MRVENFLNFLEINPKTGGEGKGNFFEVLLQVFDELFENSDGVFKSSNFDENFLVNFTKKDYSFSDKFLSNKKLNVENLSPEVILFLNQFVKIFQGSEKNFVFKNTTLKNEIPKVLGFLKIELPKGEKEITLVKMNKISLNKKVKEKFERIFKSLISTKEINPNEKIGLIPLKEKVNFLTVEGKSTSNLQQKTVDTNQVPDKVYEYQKKSGVQREAVKPQKKQEITPHPGVVVELKEWKGENVPKVHRSEGIFSVKNVRIFEGNEKKSVSVKLDGLGIQLSFVKDSANLRINLNEVMKNFFFTPYDALKVSQILHSYGFKLESISVNGSEIYKNRERERSNIKVNELMGEGINSVRADGNISILL